MALYYNSGIGPRELQPLLQAEKDQQFLMIGSSFKEMLSFYHYVGYCFSAEFYRSKLRFLSVLTLVLFRS